MWNASSLGPHAGDKNNRNVTRFSRPNRVPTPRTQALPIFWRNARRGEEEMFHVEHFDPAVGCSIWEHSPVGSQEKSSCCAPLGGGGKFPVLCSIWNVPARVFHVEHIRQFGDGLGIWNHDQETGSCALLGAGTCPGEAKRSVFHVEHYACAQGKSLVDR